MANITKPWKKIMAVGCSHGQLADQSALDYVLDFKKRYKPHTTVHLGDAYDTDAFRKSGQPVDGDDIASDFQCGTDFLSQLEPTHFMCGNHEDRFWRLTQHRNRIISWASYQAIEELQGVCKQLKAKMTPYDIESGWIEFGDTLFGHGYMFNENALRDHAEYLGQNVVMAHIHYPAQIPGRSRNGGHCFSTGFLGDKSKFSYAKTRKTRARWNHGIVFGEYSPTSTALWLIQRNQKIGKWNSPI